MIKSWKVQSEESGEKLISFLKLKLGGDYSSKHLKKSIENNQCQINGRTERFASKVLGVGDFVEFLELSPQKSLSYSVLYEDNYFVMINKPPGYVSDGKELSQAFPHLHLLHRLDKDTSGVLMFAKDFTTREQVIDYFKKQLVQKTYLALVDGIPKKKSGIIDNYLGKHHSYLGQAIWAEVVPQQGLHAITGWELVSHGQQASLLRCFPKTGRTHQIRVHLNGMGHPILGDFQYGRKFLCPYKITRCLLHAAEISFQHKGKCIQVSAPLFSDFEQALHLLIP